MDWEGSVVRALMLWLLILWIPVAAHAADLCPEIADAIRSGHADGPVEFGSRPDMVIPVLATRAGSPIRLADPASGDVAGVLQRLHATPALVASAKARFGADLGPAKVMWLEPGRVGAIKATMGTADCTYLLFFDASSGEAREVAPPKGLSFDEAEVCGNDVAWVGAAGPVPTLMQEEDADDGAVAKLTIVPWQDDGWAPPCLMRASFKTMLSVIGAFCAEGVDCGVLQAEALGLARRLEGGGDGHVPFTLPEHLASSTALLDRLPTFGGNPLAPYTSFTSRTLFALPAAGPGNFAVIGTGSWGWRELPGYLAAIWSQEGASLRPLAGFQLLRQRAMITSVAVTSQ